MDQAIKQLYVAPSTTVFEVRQEGVLCASGERTNWDGGYDDDWPALTFIL